MNSNHPNPYLEPVTEAVAAMVSEHNNSGWPQSRHVNSGPVALTLRYEHRHIGDEIYLSLRLVDLQVEQHKRNRGRGALVLSAVEQAAVTFGIEHLLVEYVVSSVLDNMLLRRGFDTSGSPPLVSYHRYLPFQQAGERSVLSSSVEIDR